jgi:hypothetical protein
VRLGRIWTGPSCESRVHCGAAVLERQGGDSAVFAAEECLAAAEE